MERSQLTRHLIPQSHRTKAGFTLIELLVVAGITSILMLTVSSMFMTFMLSNARTNARRQLQAEGTAAINRIEFLIRNADAKGVTCSSGKIEINRNSEVITITKTSNKLTEKVGASAAVPLTTESVIVSSGPTFSCTTDAKSSSQYVVVTFSLSMDTSLNTAISLAQEFQTRVQVRNTGF